MQAATAGNALGLLRHGVMSLPMAFGIFDRDMRHTLVNDALAEMNGLSAGDLVGRTPAEIHGDIGVRAEQMYRTVLETREPMMDIDLVGETHDSEGRLRHFSLHCYPVVTPADEAVGVGVLVTETTQRRETESRLQETTDVFRALIEHVRDHAIITLDPDGRVRTWNVGAERIFGCTTDEALQRSVGELLAADESNYDVQLATARTMGRAETEGWATRTDGSRFYHHTVLTSLRDDRGELRGFTRLTRDLTERRQIEEALRHQAMHDELTGLPNRTLFNDRLWQALAHAQRRQSRTALLLLDLDRFKEINDTLGHSVGDVVLQAVAARLPAGLRDADTVARLGGDEFAIILPDIRSADEALNVAGRVREQLRPPVSVRGLDLAVDTSIGVALHPDHADTPEALLQRADVAMYRAKHTAAGASVYHGDIDADSRTRLTLVQQLRRDLAAGDLWVEYQPKVDLERNDTVAVEALVRWAPGSEVAVGTGAQAGAGGRVPPDVFIPLAEETDLILPLTSFVLGEAAQQLAQWQRDGVAVRVAVNVSARLLGHTDLFDVVVDAAESFAVAPDLLELEVTESALMHSQGTAESTMRRLRALGVRFSLDDFGTGYSSLSHLRGLPIDEIKIDRSFVRGMRSAREDETIVQTVVDLARNLGRTCVAEGIEDAHVRARLIEMGCRYGQGYHLQRPVPASELTAALRHGGSLPPQ